MDQMSPYGALGGVRSGLMGTPMPANNYGAPYPMGMFGTAPQTSPVPTGSTASGGMTGNPVGTPDDYLHNAYARSAQQDNGLSRSMQHQGQGGF